MNKNNKHIPFGQLLMFDAYDCDSKVLDDVNLLYDLLEKLTIDLGMKALIKPYVVRATSNNKRDPGGWSGFIIIQESHISFHTFVKRRFVTMDIYSCKEFDYKLVIKKMKKFFKTKNVETILETRGKKYPREDLI